MGEIVPAIVLLPSTDRYCASVEHGDALGQAQMRGDRERLRERSGSISG